MSRRPRFSSTGSPGRAWWNRQCLLVFGVFFVVVSFCFCCFCCFLSFCCFLCFWCFFVFVGFVVFC
ncbi:hypothetical protein METBIDRAFT_132925 [Metschnikowia bicuspidata var. bicuspidata NRRL YB-4993]|uniref:Uncharacterized protein n=1 Tax=Metschnikowia bicuspidata var. bicuspidata NRRL YB-4993 TaxID=869754 RepID=A0A1A0HKJ5_9ASCO|nr:hypothetical protein METBIDRAFT_132925 [Metschnikowia bicuspidata var. bicuspidata NRRL YB-4993]OBA24412.1 hypothetical protein METBIDRAFT_132925 [Metschnikowia bicuspidata var. bicuspidata NRRL YB-4993]